MILNVFLGVGYWVLAFGYWVGSRSLSGVEVVGRKKLKMKGD